MTDENLRGISDWRVAHEALTRLARMRAGLDFEEGQQLRAAQRARVHERLGYGSFVEYIGRLFGYSPRLTSEKLRVAEALDELPQLAESLRNGSASWSSLRELTRVATAETERKWLEAARGRTMREVEKLVSGHRPGDVPGAVKDWRLERHVLRFEVTGEVLATFREAVAALRRDAGGKLDDDAALLLMARHVLAGSADEHDERANYQVALTVCEACARAAQLGDGDSVPISHEIAEMARCDAQELRLANADGAADSEGDAISETHAGHGVDAHAGRDLGRRRPRATQTIPPAVRRAVLLRDQHRCQVPGCRHATFVDVHHLRARQDGGRHEPDNLLTLCGAHHRACHRGELLIERLAAGTLSFRHADGTEYGNVPTAAAVDVVARSFRALRGLGFSEGEVREALHQASAHVGIGLQDEAADFASSEQQAVERLVRKALDRLTQNAWAKAS